MTSGAGGWWRTALGLLVLCCLAVPAGLTVAAAAWAVLQPTGLDYAEPVVYAQAMRIASGDPLYQPIDAPPFTVAAYTPLYYWLAGTLQLIAGAGFWPGRLLSLVAGLSTSAIVGLIAGRGNRSAWVATFGGLLFLALAFPGPVPWLALYRVDVVGVALSVAAVGVLIRSNQKRAVVTAGLLAGLAMLCKQTLIAAVIAGTLWRWRDWPNAARFFLGPALLTFAIPCLALEVTSRGAFLENTVVANLNPFHPSIAAGLLPMFLETQWLPLLLALVYVVVRRPWLTADGRLLVLFWSASSLWLLGIAKIGASSNYWIEFAAATAILAARGAALVMGASSRVVGSTGAVGLILAVGLSVGGPGGLRGTAAKIRSEAVAGLGDSSPNVEFQALVDRVRREPRGVLAEPMDVAVLAGRPVLLEPFIYNLLLDAGRWRPDSLIARICSGDIGLLVLGYPIDVGARMTDGLYALWPAPIMTALQDSMSLDTVTATRYVYIARPPAQTCRVTGSVER